VIARALVAAGLLLGGPAAAQPATTNPTALVLSDKLLGLALIRVAGVAAIEACGGVVSDAAKRQAGATDRAAIAFADAMFRGDAAQRYRMSVEERTRRDAGRCDWVLPQRVELEGMLTGPDGVALLRQLRRLADQAASPA
jgi:hypothetical protein